MGIRHMNARPRHQVHKDLKVTTTTIRSMDIEHMNVDPSLTGQQTSRQRYCWSSFWVRNISGGFKPNNRKHKIGKSLWMS